MMDPILDLSLTTASDVPWLSLIVFSPMVAAGLLLCIPSNSRAMVRLVAISSTIVSLIGSIVIGSIELVRGASCSSLPPPSMI